MANKSKFAEMLTGRMLNSRWRVVRRLPKADDATGGNFSVGYIVEEVKTKQSYFLKAIDFSHVHRMGPNLPDALQQLTTRYIFERDLSRKLLVERPASRVIRAVDDGIEVVAPASIDGSVPWIIFEMGLHDIRAATSRGLLSTAAVARTMHQATLGAWQLHQRGVAHQDVKPSNVLVFQASGVKLGDLGRAVLQSGHSPFAGHLIAGAVAYSPPEHAFEEDLQGWNNVRLACDMYQLGALFVYLLCGKTLNALIKEALSADYVPRAWGGTFVGGYSSVLPLLRSAHLEAIAAATERISVGSDYMTSIRGILLELTDPDPQSRGTLRYRRGHRVKYSLEPFVAKFDALAWRLERGLRASVL